MLSDSTSGVHYIENFLSAGDQASMLHWLLHDDVIWQRESFAIFGKQIAAPRRLTWFGDAGVNYRYTGVDHVACGWPAQLQETRQQVSTVAHRAFNFVLLNRYDHGCEYMGWHRDDERAAAPSIASLSLGEVRRFRYSQPGGETTSMDLQPGSLLLFDGRLRHQLTKTKQYKQCRINLTFRHINECGG